MIDLDIGQVDNFKPLGNLQKICKMFAKYLQNICKTSKNDGKTRKKKHILEFLQAFCKKKHVFRQIFANLQF